VIFASCPPIYTAQGSFKPYLLNGYIEDPLKHDALKLHEFAYHRAFNQCSCFVQLTHEVPITFKTRFPTISAICSARWCLHLTRKVTSHQFILVFYISVYLSSSTMCSTPLSTYKPLKCTHTVPVWHAMVTPNMNLLLKLCSDYFMTPIFTVIFTYLLLLLLTFQCCHVYSWHYLTVKLASEKARTLCCYNTISMMLNE